MRKIITRVGLMLLCLVALAMFVPAAYGTTVAFSCSGVSSCATPPSTGIVTGFAGSGPFSTATSISVFNSQGIPGMGPGPFALTFSTAAGTIGISTPIGSLLGTFSSFTLITGGTTKTIVMSVFWGTLPPAVAAFLGTPTGLDNTSITFHIADGATTDVSVTITPTPEPGSMLLFGSGLLAVGTFLRRRLKV